MEQKYSILVVEDDKEIRAGVEIYLKNQEIGRASCRERV